MKYTRQRGVSMISTIIGVLALLMISSYAFKYAKAMNSDSTYKERGVQYVTVLEGLKQYGLKYRSNLYSGQVVPGYTTYSPSIAELKNGGFISQNFNPSSETKLGGELKTIIQVEPSGCTSNCLIALYVVPSTPITGSNGQPDYAVSNTVADGMKGFGWSNSPMMPQIVSKGTASISNPLTAMPAVALAAYWIPSNQTLSNFTNTETQTLPCPAPQVGVILQTRTKTELQAGGFEYTPWVTTSQTCANPPPPPVCANGGTDYPVCTPPKPPVCANGGTDYPVCTPPACANGALDYPTCTPPVCANGSPNYPKCDFPPPPPPPASCQNGSPNYPKCDFPPPPKTSCDNGTPDFPTCKRYKIYSCPTAAGYPDGYIDGYDRVLSLVTFNELDQSNVPIEFPYDIQGDVRSFVYFKGSVISGKIFENARRGWTGYFYDDGADSVRGLQCASGNGN